ncbi:hypothetical protein DMC47_00090 [Nostoc sp. 3335mG]|nr:hypothetical protein DMC47_00090 [Nostoc sp. 3335mG]
MATAIFNAQRGDKRRIFGPLLNLSQLDRGAEFVVIRSIVSVDAIVPLLGHSERKTMLIVDGTMSARLDGEWRRCGPGEIIDVSPGVPHALRNYGPDEVAVVLVTSERMARFREAISTTRAVAAVTPERLAHVGRTVAASGFLTAGPEEHAAIGIQVPGLSKATEA